MKGDGPHTCQYTKQVNNALYDPNIAFNGCVTFLNSILLLFVKLVNLTTFFIHSHFGGHIWGENSICGLSLLLLTSFRSDQSKPILNRTN